MVQRQQMKQLRLDDKNIARRERYKTDDDYRERLKDKARTRYRETIAGQRTNPTRLADAHTISTLRNVVLPDGQAMRVATFTTSELAELLGVERQALYRWHRNKMFPAPVAQTVSGVRVYLSSEARALAKVYGDHRKVVSHLRKKHVSTIARLFDAASVERMKAGLL